MIHVQRFCNVGMRLKCPHIQDQTQTAIQTKREQKNKRQLNQHCGITATINSDFNSFNSKEKGNDQEEIQSNTIPDPGHHMGK